MERKIILIAKSLSTYLARNTNPLLEVHVYFILFLSFFFLTFKQKLEGGEPANDPNVLSEYASGPKDSIESLVVSLDRAKYC